MLLPNPTSQGVLKMMTPWVVAKVTAYFVTGSIITLETTLLYTLLLSATHFATTNLTCGMCHSVMKLGSMIRYQPQQ